MGTCQQSRTHLAELMFKQGQHSMHGGKEGYRWRWYALVCQGRATIHLPAPTSQCV